MNFLNFLTTGASRTFYITHSLQLQFAEYEFLQQISKPQRTNQKTLKLALVRECWSSA